MTKLKKFKKTFIKFMNTQTGKMLNVLTYLVFSNAVVVSADYFAKVQTENQALWYVLSVQTVNIVLVFAKQVVIPAIKK